MPPFRLSRLDFCHHRVRFFQAQFVLRLRHRPVVERDVVVREGNSLAFDGVGDDGCRSALDRLRLVQSGRDRLDVVSVNLDDMPAERAPFFRQRVAVHAVHHRAHGLKAVLVHDGHQVVGNADRSLATVIAPGD